jgi:hypothetical protein
MTTTKDTPAPSAKAVAAERRTKEQDARERADDRNYRAWLVQHGYLVPAAHV